jgi:hypothetical protein
MVSTIAGMRTRSLKAINNFLSRQAVTVPAACRGEGEGGTGQDRPD